MQPRQCVRVTVVLAGTDNDRVVRFAERFYPARRLVVGVLHGLHILQTGMVRPDDHMLSIEIRSEVLYMVCA